MKNSRDLLAWDFICRHCPGAAAAVRMVGSYGIYDVMLSEEKTTI